jgi:hypothetical protein
MYIQTYFQNQFPGHLRKMNFNRPNEIVLNEMLQDPNAMFFGGKDWRNIEEDLSSIPESDKPAFVLSLFMIIITDQCIHSHFKDRYPDWHRKTMFPKFGWTGFGYHMENPMKILWIPEKRELINPDAVIALIPSFISFFKKETESYMNQHLPDIETATFFKAILNDADFKFNYGSVNKEVKNEMGKMI